MNITSSVLHDGKVLQVRSFGVCFYVLKDIKGLYLVDGGFVGGMSRLKSALEIAGWSNEPILGVMLTHGHLDHVLNVAAIANSYGAWIAAPRGDQKFYDGQPIYSGISRVTGLFEALGRHVLGFRKFIPDRLLEDGDILDVWSGLKVVSLPGHTAGHCGFYCERTKLLFCGDLFASFGKFSHLPPHFFNYDSEQIVSSIEKALALELSGVFPNHCDKSTSTLHLERLKQFE